MVDWRTDFDEILRQFGDRALLVHTDRRNPCPCVELQSGSPDKGCRLCLGTGWRAYAEVVHCRSTMSTGTGSRARGFQADSYGASAEYHREWYLHRNNRVLPKDLIVFCDWAGDAPIFSDQTDIYEIATVNILRGEGGADQYIKASANSDPVNLSLRLSVITRNIATVDYYVSIRPEGT